MDALSPEAAAALAAAGAIALDRGMVAVRGYVRRRRAPPPAPAPAQIEQTLATAAEEQLEPAAAPAAPVASGEQLEALLGQAVSEQLTFERGHHCPYDEGQRTVAVHQRAARLAAVAGVRLPCDEGEHPELWRCRCELVPTIQRALCR